MDRKNSLFMRSVRDGKTAAIAYTLIEAAKLNGVDPNLGSSKSSNACPTTRTTVSTICCLGTAR